VRDEVGAWTTAAPNRVKIPTDSHNLAVAVERESLAGPRLQQNPHSRAVAMPGEAVAGERRPAGHGRPKVLATGAQRDSSRGDGEVIELECEITV
jgi:hypothetical protein